MIERERAQTAVLLAVAILWQFHIVTLAWRFLPKMLAFWSGMGMTLPPILQVVFATYRFWTIVPLLFIAFGIHALTRPAPLTLKRSIILVGSAYVAVFLMHGIITELTFGMMFNVMGKVD